MNELPTRDEFQKQLNTKFRVVSETGEPITDMELTEVSDLRKRKHYQAFSLVFQTPKTIAPEQMTYRLEHEALGTVAIFLAPFEEDENDYRFEAIFNQKVSDAGD